MTKTIIKEIGIAILILIVIVLVLAILFYDYIPNNKTVPIEIQPYTIPEEIDQELEEAMPTEQNIVRTYYIDSSDLNLYESTNDYDKGKANPFADYASDVQNTNSSNQTDNKVNTNITNSNNNQNNSQSNNQSNTDKNEVYINTPGKNY